MVSICIPIYNYDTAGLIQSLQKEINTHQLVCEIIVIDDASENPIRNLHKNIEAIQYIQLQENVGRAKIRNLFLQYASHPYLLFLDCDVFIIHEDFIRKYIQTIEKNSSLIVCGGRTYPTLSPGKKKQLRWKYGIKKESQPASLRKVEPNKSFMTNNFLMHRSIFEQIKFDESLTQYGHEDTLFGFELHQLGIEISHIENPILNGDIEDNEIFLKKTKDGVQNLAKIYNALPNKEAFKKFVHLLQVYENNKNLHLIITLIYWLFRPAILFSLKKGWGSISCFNFYKLSEFIRFYKKL